MNLSSPAFGGYCGSDDPKYALKSHTSRTFNANWALGVLAPSVYGLNAAFLS